MNNTVREEIFNMTEINASTTGKLPEDHSIQGVLFADLVSHGDKRGFFREVVRFDQPIFKGEKFGQWSHSRMQHQVVKAWHYHHVQVDWWYVPYGQIETVLYDNRSESPTYGTKLVFRMGDRGEYPDAFTVLVKIPQGVLHGCQVLSDTADLFYITSETYNPDDEGRFPYNDEVVAHLWPDKAIVADNDKRRFEPKSPRKQMAA